MPEVRYDSLPELQRPANFLREALADLRTGLSLGPWLLRGAMRTRFRGAGLGYLWLVLPPAAAGAVGALVQSTRVLAHMPTSLPYPVFVLAGMAMWQVFVEALNAPAAQFRASRAVATRTSVPHEALLIAALLEVLVNCGVRLAVLAVALLLFQVAVAPTLLLVPVGMAALAVFGFALGLLLLPFGLLYDDVGRAKALATTFWFFLTPILYPLPAQGWWALNPVTPLLATTRSWITGPAATGGFALVSAAAVAALVLGWLLYRVARPHVVARLG